MDSCADRDGGDPVAAGHEDGGRACAPAGRAAASPDGHWPACRSARRMVMCFRLRPRRHAGAGDGPTGNLARQSAADDRGDRTDRGPRHRCGRRRRAARPRPTGHTRLRRALRTWRALSAAADRLCRAGSRVRGRARCGVHPAAVPLRAVLAAGHHHRLLACSRPPRCSPRCG